LQLEDNTVVLLWGAHGYHLGEQGLWTKANNYELSTRVPLIISISGRAHRGTDTDALVEFVDVYPTLTDICGLDAPVGVEGISLMPLLVKPDRAWKSAVFSQYPRANKGNRHRGHGDIMGYAIRTDHFRYVEWHQWKTKQVVARELYDYKTDSHEMKNVAAETDRVSTVQKLSQRLAEGWKAALPRDYK
jgi:arylsulfatase A-like enzyme